VLPQQCDQLWVLGDLVNYGPNPADVVRFVREHASQVVRGNHDHAVGYGEDPQCYGHYRALAEATGEFSREHLSMDDREFLRTLPLQMELKVEGTWFRLCHAIPSNSLFGYAPPQAIDVWNRECAGLACDVLFVGHTHIPFVKKFGNCLVVNPGSLGQPNNRTALACYAMWENGRVSLCSTVYDVATTIRKVQSMPVPEDIRRDVIALLRGEPISVVELPSRDSAILKIR
jgi:putative phosphoesterase